jgi:hypothetical protein
MKTLGRYPIILFVLTALLLLAALPQPSPNSQTDNPNPPDEVVKLIFIHHSTGENWLTDGYGDLGRTLGENNYFVSDTNYGWGPDSIGDRTDIPNWTEWFASDSTPTYMDAVYNESGQNSSYTRTLSDPGGENEIVMFKSCFPNSALEGSPNDPPGTYEELSVSGAKYVYNTILGYFAAHPDKLFVVITAPPLSDSTYADNARAFNQWLVDDWLRENNYTLNNVAVFDFYNILTDPNAHHRVNNGQIEHTIGARNTEYYPSADDHPSVEGSRKATEEFLPMLNVFYHRWKESAPLQSAPAPGTTTETVPQSQQPAAVASSIDNFDAGPVPGSNGWEAFRDEAVPSTTMTCGAESGTGRSGNSLKHDFNIAANSWGTCALMYETPQDWSTGNGLVFYYRTAQAGVIFDVDLYAGPSENRETYLYTVEAPAESINSWIPLELRWEDFHRADWEENAGTPFAKANQVTGMAFGFGTLPDTPKAGTLWVDDLSLLGVTRVIIENTPPAPAPTSAPEQSGQTEQPKRPLLPCTGAAVLPLSLIVGLGLLGRKRE